jgi:DDE superfamily endonuclease
MHCESFHRLLSMIKDHPVFQSDGTKQQEPVAHQLLVLLLESGSGANNPTLRNMFQIGRGTPEEYKRRCIKAIRSLRDSVIHWPDQNKRPIIARCILHQYNWPNCIGVVDGTLFPLGNDPRSEDAPDYHGRKFLYSMSTIIVNDDTKRMRHYLAGFPGSTHDNRIYSNTELFNYPDKYFGDNYFVLGDSAFENTNTMVTSFEKLSRESLSKEKEGFNTYVGRLRITSEHTIGMLEGRFQFL